LITQRIQEGPSSIGNWDQERGRDELGCLKVTGCKKCLEYECKPFGFGEISIEVDDERGSKRLFDKFVDSIVLPDSRVTRDVD